MDEKQRKEYLNEFKEYMGKKAVSREEAIQFMKDIGVYTKKGCLSRQYKADRYK